MFESDYFFTVTFKRPQIHALPIEKIPEKMLSGPHEILTDNEIRICKQIDEDKSITVVEIMERLDIAESTVNRTLKLFTEKGIITRVGSKRAGSWKLLKPLHPDAYRV